MPITFRYDRELGKTGMLGAVRNFTVLEKRRTLKGLKLVYIGDGNNMAHSLLHGCSKVGMNITIASPSGYMPHQEIVAESKVNAKYMGSKIEITEDPVKAVSGADIIYTDVWASMGWEQEAAIRKRKFAKFQVNQALVKHANEHYIFMHCLPARRNEEVTDAVIDSPQSIVFDQAENRMHAQKALLLLLLGGLN